MKILIVGGASSGKSGIAQELAIRLGENPYYWATMISTGTEDDERIRAHIKNREGMGFETVERPLKITKNIKSLDRKKTVLFDSLTALLANEMFAGGFVDEGAAKRCTRDVLEAANRFKDFICVADNIWMDGDVLDETSEMYKKGLAQICRELADDFDCVYEVVAGRINVQKGELL